MIGSSSGQSDFNQFNAKWQELTLASTKRLPPKAFTVPASLPTQRPTKAAGRVHTGIRKILVVTQTHIIVVLQSLRRALCFGWSRNY